MCVHPESCDIEELTVKLNTLVLCSCYGRGALRSFPSSILSTQLRCYMNWYLVFILFWRGSYYLFQCTGIVPLSFVKLVVSVGIKKDLSKFCYFQTFLHSFDPLHLFHRPIIRSVTGCFLFYAQSYQKIHQFSLFSFFILEASFLLPRMSVSPGPALPPTQSSSPCTTCSSLPLDCIVSPVPYFCSFFLYFLFCFPLVYPPGASLKTCMGGS